VESTGRIPSVSTESRSNTQRKKQILVEADRATAYSTGDQVNQQEHQPLVTKVLSTNYLYSKLVSISFLETNLESKLLVAKILIANLDINLKTIL